MSEIEYTPNLALAKQPTGAREWGTVLNENFDKIDEGFGKVVDYTDITNCILEVPQDIKLELNNGVLTLKAGSKVYRPNGAGKFDVITTTRDCSMSGGIGAPNTKIFIAYKDNALTSRSVSQSVSGAGATTSGGFAFDTTANKMNFYNSSGVLQSEDWSFPIAIVSTDSSGVASSIDQVFNGFGKIGSTAVVLPGVKGLMPNGRNADGTLKNTEFTVSSVVTTTFSETQNDVDCVLQGTTIWARNQTVVKSASEIGTVTGNFYIIDDNIFVYSNAGSLTNPLSRIVIGKISLSSGVITSFTPKLPFRAVDYNEVKSLGATITYWE